MSAEDNKTTYMPGTEASKPSADELARAALALLDDILVDREHHGLSPRVARELQLAASAVTHERFRIAIQELVRKLGDKS